MVDYNIAVLRWDTNFAAILDEKNKVIDRQLSNVMKSLHSPGATGEGGSVCGGDTPQKFYLKLQSARLLF